MPTRCATTNARESCPHQPAMPVGAGSTRRPTSKLIEMLVHLRATGMPLAQIAEFTGLAAHGSGRAERFALLRRHLRSVLEQRDRLDASLDVIGRKIAGYDGGPTAGRNLTGPDCDIAYTIRGTGPLLYLVGAPVGRSGFAPLAEQLADEYKLVTHDPRGIDASVAQPGASEPTPQVLADDLAALARHVGEPATFFGASGGAVTVLGSRPGGRSRAGRAARATVGPVAARLGAGTAGGRRVPPCPDRSSGGAPGILGRHRSRPQHVRG